MRIERAKYGFHGGQVLPSRRQALNPSPIHWVERFGWPAQLHVPLGQYFIDPTQSTVTLAINIGDRVMGHQALTVVDSDQQVPVHAPTSGVVTARRQINGHDCLLLVPDGEHDCIKPDQSDWQSWSADALIDRLRELGLCGLGGARFPTAAKLRGPWSSPHTLILNGVECEPGTGCDHVLLREQRAAVLSGGLILAKACGAQQLIVAVDDSDDALLSSLLNDTAAESQAQADALGITMHWTVVPARYPAGSERQLIEQLTGQQVPLRGVPQDLGVVTHNVGTAAAAHALITTGEPLTQRLVTVNSDDATPASDGPWGSYWMPLGLPIESVLEALALTDLETQQLRIGGPLTGQVVDDLATTVHAGCHLLWLAAKPQIRKPMPCIQCSACVEVCPASVMPQWLHQALTHSSLADQPLKVDVKADVAVQLDACVACGLCDTVCPSEIPLTAQFRAGQQQLAGQRHAQRQAEAAKQRFEARQARLAREAAAREAKRQAREARLRSSASAQDEIAAALARAKAKANPNASSNANSESGNS